MRCVTLFGCSDFRDGFDALRIKIELENPLKAARSRFNVAGVGRTHFWSVLGEVIVFPLRAYVMNETSLPDPVIQ